ncbi:hypothetical protein BS47DRAFT_732567 [Hydnum rufescens UP504]|uniref:Uncharacterized protein n=1 Tax=Hydnum rufescens UP504 TaxID=1448309 RepID=A0A9P6B1I7_9AGAM|nr:hypothetical protein BS47DRAFT_732567 [Hydnum rufescens UP504]
MSEHAHLPNPDVYFIISRVLAPDGVRRATKYNGDNQKLTLEPFSEHDQTQWGNVVIAETAVRPQLWLFRGGTPPEGLRIDELDSSVAEPRDRIWTDIRGLSGDDINLEHEHGSFGQRWVLQRVPWK